MAKLTGIVLIVALLALICVISTQARIKVNPHNNFFEDEHGRVRIYHGVNAVEKIFPWYPDPYVFDANRSLNAFDAANLHHWGFNFVRLGTMWPGLEAIKGNYNMSYLKELRVVVDNLAKYDIPVLLDMHQDILSRHWCGEGVPDWAAYSTNTSMNFPRPAVWGDFPKDKNGYPELDACLKYNFGIFYFAEQVNQGFQALYSNTNGIRDAFINFWRIVASFFKDHPNVIGYEFINEPWAGNIYNDISLLLKQGHADLVNLQPLYDMTAAAIRQIDNTRLIFYDPATIDQVWGTYSGFKVGPGGPEHNETNVYSYHTYCTLAERDGTPWSPMLCDLLDEYYFGLWTSTVKRLGGGGMMTEWGALSQNDASMQQIHKIASLADQYLQSWAWWQFKNYDDITTAATGDVESFYDTHGQLQVKKVKALSRTYAQAITGVPTHMFFDHVSGNFTLRYNQKAGIPQTVPTVVFLNQEWYYPRGFNAITYPPGMVFVEQKEVNYLNFYSHRVPSGTEVRITISPR